MSKQIDPMDIVGKTYKNIRVDSYTGVKISGNRSRHYYNCTCIFKDINGNICGKQFESERYALVYETTESCGSHTGLYNPYDIEDCTFGFIKVNYYIGKIGLKHYYNCTCRYEDKAGNVCGNIFTADRYSILNGNIKSCGCMNSIDIYDIVGKTFGYLRVDSFYGRKNGYCSYNCTCLNINDSGNICGNTTIVDRQNLIDGKIRSCGCYRSKVSSERNRLENPYDIIGKIFGFLRVDEYIDNRDYNRILYKCTCLNKDIHGNICNKETYVDRNHLLTGHTKSCGCYAVTIMQTHGLSNHPLYHTWYSMRDRCNNPNNHSYSDYGGRGIKVCKEWDNDIDGLQNFINDMYPQYLEIKRNYPDIIPSIDRIDVDGNYEVGNCRYATPIDQAYNRRSTKYVYYKGERYNLKDLLDNFCEDKVSYALLLSRLSKPYFCKNNTIINEDIFKNPQAKNSS